MSRGMAGTMHLYNYVSRIILQQISVLLAAKFFAI